MCLVYTNNIDFSECRAALVDTDDTKNECGHLKGTDKALKAVEGTCCGWVNQDFLYKNQVNKDGVENNYCGVISSDGSGKRKHCCGLDGENGVATDCDAIGNPTGFAAEYVALFSRDEGAWLDYYLKAWTMSTTNGFSDLTSLSGLEDEDKESLSSIVCGDYTTKKKC